MASGARVVVVDAQQHLAAVEAQPRRCPSARTGEAVVQLEGGAGQAAAVHRADRRPCPPARRAAAGPPGCPAVPSTPSTPGRDSASSSRSSRSARLAMASRRSPTPRAPRAGWSAAMRISRRPLSDQGRRTRRAAASAIASGRCARVRVNASYSVLTAAPREARPSMRGGMRVPAERGRQLVVPCRYGQRHDDDADSRGHRARPVHLPASRVVDRPRRSTPSGRGAGGSGTSASPCPGSQKAHPRSEDDVRPGPARQDADRGPHRHAVARGGARCRSSRSSATSASPARRRRRTSRSGCRWRGGPGCPGARRSARALPTLNYTSAGSGSRTAVCTSRAASC